MKLDLMSDVGYLGIYKAHIICSLFNGKKPAALTYDKETCEHINQICDDDRCGNLKWLPLSVNIANHHNLSKAAGTFFLEKNSTRASEFLSKVGWNQKNTSENQNGKNTRKILTSVANNSSLKANVSIERSWESEFNKKFLVVYNKKDKWKTKKFKKKLNEKTK